MWLSVRRRCTARALSEGDGVVHNPPMARWAVSPDDAEPPRQVVVLAEQVERDGGRALALYQEPVGDHWQIFCLLPIERVEATPYQRDLSPAHVKRLQEVVKKLKRFVDPIVVMSAGPGV